MWPRFEWTYKIKYNPKIRGKKKRKEKRCILRRIFNFEQPKYVSKHFDSAKLEEERVI